MNKHNEFTIICNKLILKMTLAKVESHKTILSTLLQKFYNNEVPADLWLVLNNDQAIDKLLAACSDNPTWANINSKLLAMKGQTHD